MITSDVLRLVRVWNIPKNLLWFLVGAAPMVRLGPEPAALLLPLSSFLACWFFVYSLNDCVDSWEDKKHKRKSLRPIASGRISRPEAVRLAVGLAVISALLAFFVSSLFLLVILSTLLAGILYNSKSFGGRSNIYFASTLLWAMEFFKLLAGATYASGIVIPWALFIGLPSFYLFAYHFYWEDARRFGTAKATKLGFLFLSVVSLGIWLVPVILNARAASIFLFWGIAVLLGMRRYSKSDFEARVRLSDYFIMFSLFSIILISIL